MNYTIFRIIKKKSDGKIYVFNSLVKRIYGPYKDINAAKKARQGLISDDVMESLGLLKVKSISGKTYWE